MQEWWWRHQLELRLTRTTAKLPDNETPPDAAPRPLLEEALTHEIIGAFYTVYNALGYGLLESVYTTALCLELTRRGLRVEREVRVEVFCGADKVGTFRADVLVESRVVVENKATRVLSATDRPQLLNCLRCSNLEVGLLLHFGPRPAFHRVVAKTSRCS